MEKIKYSKPLLYPLLKLFFPKLDWERHIITFGSIIYTKHPIAQHRIVHEQVHIEQFKKHFHFLRYLFSRKYRYQSELKAFRAEYKFVKEVYRIHIAQRHLENMARILSSPLYKNIITLEEAIQEIKDN